jgi:hypothetical protein
VHLSLRESRRLWLSSFLRVHWKSTIAGRVIWLSRCNSNTLCGRMLSTKRYQEVETSGFLEQPKVDWEQHRTVLDDLLYHPVDDNVRIP